MRRYMDAPLTVLLFFIAVGCAGGAAPKLPDTSVVDVSLHPDAFGRDTPPASNDSDTSPVPDETDGEDPWVFDRDDFEPVHGWVLLNARPESVEETIAAAARYGVNHIQLSHGLIMNIEDILGDDPAATARVEALNLGIRLAHENGMKAFIWTHELSGTGTDICYEPGDPVWEARADAYRRGIARIPDVDGVVVMFGSAPVPPWFTVCTCAYCQENYDDPPFYVPPRAERLRIITEQVGGVIVHELGKELIMRAFVHQPDENAWHADGLSAVEGVDFLSMHKGPVQDWQPYNPHDPTFGRVGNRPSIVELDLAGEYYGLSVLPFCAPGYVRYRMRHMWENYGIGAVVRVERGAHSALGTPNEVNLFAVRDFMEDPGRPLAHIWDAFLTDAYGLAPGEAGQKIARRTLEATFPIRLKSHYVLGIWALNKNSDLPEDERLGQFTSRGRMPAWDPAWQDHWDRLNRPDRALVEWIWQEGSEAVDLADESLAAAFALSDVLPEDKARDLLRRMRHQLLAARAWRAVSVFIWAHRARNVTELEDELLARWMAWAHEDLHEVRVALEAHGFAGVAVASPERIGSFLANTVALVPDVSSEAPPPALFSPIRVAALSSERAEIVFSTQRAASVHVDHGPTLPHLAGEVEIGAVTAGEEVRVTIEGLQPGGRHFVRLRAEEAGEERYGGDFWLFPPLVPREEGESCTPDCLGRCPGADDGCNAPCPEDDCRGRCVATICLTEEWDE